MSDELDVLRDELKLLKDEQRDRIRARDNLVYSVIIASAAVIGGVRLGGPAVPLLLPPITLALGWTFLINDQKITAIGRYLRDDLRQRLTDASGAEALRWEITRLDDRRRRQRKCIQLAFDLLVFVLPAAGALTRYWATGVADPGLLIVSLAEAVAVFGVGWQFIAYAEVGRA